MDRVSTVERLLREYGPDAVIMCLPDNDDPSEIIVEGIDVGAVPNGTSRAVALIEQSVAHVHRVMTESYFVEDGELLVSISDVAQSHFRNLRLKAGQTLVIEPNRVHCARGIRGPAKVVVDCTPPWTPQDHILTALPSRLLDGLE